MTMGIISARREMFIKMFVKEILHLSEEVQKQFYRELSEQLLSYFGESYYDDEEELQESFHEWKSMDMNDYRKIVDSILKEIAPEGIELNWRHIRKLNYKRWKLCKVCGTPYIDMSKFNRTSICYSTTYKRYRQKQGTFNKMGLEGKSTCQMASHARNNRTSNKDTYEYVRPF